MITFYIWLQLSLVCLLGAMSPGPSVALIINNTIKKNRLNGIITSIGHGLGVSFYALLAVLGLGILIENYFNIFIGFQITGSCFLIAIGLHAIFSANKHEINEINSEKVISASSFIQGFLIAFLNPKILVFFTALFSQFIHTDAIISDKIILVLTPGIIDTVWYIFISIAITFYSVNNFININKVIIQKVMGSLLIIIALTILYKFI